MRRWIPPDSSFRANRLFVRALLLALALGAAGQASAYAQLRVTPTTWNVVGLDSNNVTRGPDLFPVGVRVCNTSAATLNNVAAAFVWDSANPYVNLSEASALGVRTLAPLACTDFYFPVVVTRTTAAYNTARRFHVNVTADGVPPVSTPTPREIYVEKLVSQNRNSVRSIDGPTSVFVGFTYNYAVVADTATQGYEQLEAFLNFSNVVFQVLAVSTVYSSPAGATNDKFYADACGWQNNPLLANYRSCVGPSNFSGGKAGGLVTTVYTVKRLSTGTTTITSMIYDFSGSSYHYNSDFGRGLTITAFPYQPNIVLTKSVAPAGNVLPGAELTYTIAFENNGNAPASSLVINDPIPASTDL
ncbi:MAG TPA: hypothetical protein VEQ42_10790, partial [Pyrinomonadaceae bacterium]|nr:hypothetical protein [Pyrinomonadaceae bacterium]